MHDSERRTLLVLLNTFPFGEGEEFFAYELPYLTEEFRVTLAPRQHRGPRRELPDDVAVKVQQPAGLAPLRPTVRAARDTAKEILQVIRAQDGNGARIRRLQRLLEHARGGLRAAKALRAFQHDRRFAEGDVILSYWGNLSAVALSWGTRPYAVRLGGYDLYLDRNRDEYRPFQRTLLRRASVILAPSQHARDYLVQRYPEVRERLMVSRRGVPRQDQLALHSDDGILRLLSISTISGLKRPELIAHAVRLATNEGIDVHWTHVGDGLRFEELRDLVAELGITGLTDLIGRVGPGESGVFPLLRSRPFDLMVNASTSEGLPSSLQEALSFGIPVMATDVGGNTEIVQASDGVLLPPNPQPEDLLCGIRKAAGRSDANRAQARRAAVTAQRELFDSEANMRERCRVLRDLPSVRH